MAFMKPTDLDVGYLVTNSRERLRNAARSYLGLCRQEDVGHVIGATIGKTGYARLESATNQQMNALIPKPKVVDPRWLYWQANTSNFNVRC